MKKRKTYEISVIDKTYSKTISDETKFYASDTALELGFELKETEYTFESAEIVLLNIDDRSLVTRPVAKVLDSFAYELDDDIIAHYGEWRGQVRFEQAGETYVSSPVKFRIENDLGNERPPQLSDVQSWVSLKRYADGLVDELKQAVLSIDELEYTLNENETIRQTTFETNESERDETFNNNEDIRQTQELEREKAEVKRQSEFDDNEASRFDTFNDNETTRQTNETTRQQAEGERESAESNRASAEEQRKTDHANRSAELAGKADKVVLKNELVNPNFSNGLIGWDVSVENESVVDGNEVTITTTSEGRYGLFQNYNQEGLKYISAEYYSEDEMASFTLGNTLVVTTVPNGVWTRVSTVNSDKGLIRFYGHSGLDNHYKMRKPIIINLTQTFGAGNEPTKEEMAELIKVIGYIDGEYALNNKEMLIWTLALIHRNKNAIISLGGTI